MTNRNKIKIKINPCASVYSNHRNSRVLHLLNEFNCLPNMEIGYTHTQS